MEVSSKTFRDRIVELRRVPARELIANPRAWRRHRARQAAALRGLLQEVGYADAPLARETAGGLVLIDGHLRAETACGLSKPDPRASTVLSRYGFISLWRSASLTRWTPDPGGGGEPGTARPPHSGSPPISLMCWRRIVPKGPGRTKTYRPAAGAATKRQMHPGKLWRGQARN